MLDPPTPFCVFATNTMGFCSLVQTVVHQALGAANCGTCKLTTLQRKVGRRLSSGCEPPSFSYGTGQSLGFLFTSSVVGRRVLVLSSGWLASYVGQSEVPALITSLYFFPFRFFCLLSNESRSIFSVFVTRDKPIFKPSVLTRR